MDLYGRSWWIAGACVALTAAAVGCSAVRASQEPPASTDAVVEGWLADERAAGVVVGIASPGGREVVTAGSADSDPPLAMAPEHRFRIGSVTKTFVAATVLQLVDEGRVRLRDGAAAYVDALPDGSGITVEHLLAHTSGLPSYHEAPAFIDAVGGDLAGRLAPADVVGYALAQPLTGAPGERFAYSPTNYVALGVLVERATGTPLHEELARRLLRPLGLDSTELPAADVRPEGLATGYSTRWAGRFDGAVVDTTTVPVTAIASASWAEGAMVSDVDDLLEWTRALYAGDVLPGHLRDAMVTAGTPESPYGLGAYRFDTAAGAAVGHGGDWFGYRSEVRYVAEHDLVIVALANGDEADLVRLVDDLLRARVRGEAPSPATEDLLTGLQAPDAGARRAAALDLGRRPPASATVQALVTALRSDPDPEVRAAAALALGFAGTAAPSTAEAALRDALGDVPAVRDAATAALDALVGER